MENRGTPATIGRLWQPRAMRLPIGQWDGIRNAQYDEFYNIIVVITNGAVAKSRLPKHIVIETIIY